MPKVSIIIPTYNYGNFICHAIDSVLIQTYNDFEILVIDDGSTDNTARQMDRYKHKVKYYYRENRGVSAARNFGIERSNGEYIAFLDADDLFFPEKLDIQVNILDLNVSKGVGLIYSDYLCVNSYNTSILKYYKSKEFKSQNEALNYLLNNNFINTSTVMVNKKCFDKVGLFNENYNYLEDLDLWIRIGLCYEFEYINKPLVKTRSHSSNHRNKVNRLEKIQCYKKIRSNFINYRSLND